VSVPRLLDEVQQLLRRDRLDEVSIESRFPSPAAVLVLAPSGYGDDKQ